jgi:hypothetical protein
MFSIKLKKTRISGQNTLPFFRFSVKNSLLKFYQTFSIHPVYIFHIHNMYF